MSKKGKPASAKQVYSSTKGRAMKAFQEGKISAEEARRRLEQAARMAEIDSEAQTKNDIQRANEEMRRVEQERRRNGR